MKLHCTLVLILTAILSSCTKKHSIEGSITGLGNDTLIIGYSNLNDPFKHPNTSNLKFEYDTIYSHDDQFFYDVKTQNPILVKIRPLKGFKKKDGSYFQTVKSDCFSLVVPQGKTIYITGTKNKNGVDCLIDGADFNTDYSKQRKQLLAYYIDQKKLYREIDSLKNIGVATTTIDSLWKVSNNIDRLLGKKYNLCTRTFRPRLKCLHRLVLWSTNKTVYKI
ncbi:hypothetical protein NBRC110019_05480 [Neptunitalea chrysea]|uniref:Lipoprotein n=1 Tax=Neptunitalea chrysea TaxID=1647581 RepID=A0A9W6B566_9FLAO|nr:hypothetical protein [Neptunitalea chrysea]GLB51509.1 hypothetical protein NBRC110019_05480 [Neptunitalea chrysea]